MSPEPSRDGGASGPERRFGDVRHCIKCGREVGPDESICEICNRAGMVTPSATQYHGTVVVAIVAAVAALALAASLAQRGVGPYTTTVARVAPASVGYEVTLVVENRGTREGRAQCRIVALGAAGERLASHGLLTPPIAAGASMTVREPVTAIHDVPAQVTAECS